MSRKNRFLIVALFILSLILGGGAGVLSYLGILRIVSWTIPYIGALATAVLLSMFALGRLIAFNKSERVSRTSERILCGCTAYYIRPIVISALAVIVASILFTGVAGISLLSAFVIGFLAVFVFFTLFLLAAVVFCLVDASCCRRCRSDPERTIHPAHTETKA